MRFSFATGTPVILAGLVLGVTGCSSVSHQVSDALSAPQRRADTKMSMARVFERQGELRRAGELYAELYQRSPENVELCHRLGVISARLGHHDQAVQYFMHALETSPQNNDVLTDLGYALYLQNDLPAAELALTKALEADPRDSRATNNLALVLGNQGRIDESFAMFRRVVSEAEAHANIAFVHTQRGEGEMAVEHYSLALGLDENIRSASQALAQIAEMKNRGDATNGIQGPNQSEPTMIAEAAEEPTEAAGHQTVKLVENEASEEEALTTEAMFIAEDEPNADAENAEAEEDEQLAQAEEEELDFGDWNLASDESTDELEAQDEPWIILAEEDEAVDSDE